MPYNRLSLPFNLGVCPRYLKKAAICAREAPPPVVI